MPHRIIQSPNLDPARSLGFLANAWMEFLVVHGPGDIQGERVFHGEEIYNFICRAYGLDQTGSLVHDSAFLSRPKGADKSGLAARLGLFEALGPCRFGGWAEGGEKYEDPWGLGFTYNYGPGEPMGRPVNVPYVRIMATEESQTGCVYDTIFYNLNDDDAPLKSIGVDVGLTRTNIPGGGQIIPSTASSASKDGGKETWLALDEPLDLDTPVATVDGWKTIGTLQIGDYVFGVDGKPILVWGVAPIKYDRDCYRVTFDDGESVVTDSSHRWWVYDRYSAQKWIERTTLQMAESNWFGKRRFGLKQPEALEMEDADLPIDPYVFGYNAAFCNKPIPDVYLWASKQQRLALLHGLVDSGGRVTGGGVVTFTNANPGLVSGVEHLVRSLGRRCPAGEGKVSFTLSGIVPLRYIESIEPVESRPVRCIAVDSDDHLFLVGDSMLPTHNTHLYNTPELRRMYSTVTRNLRKRKRIAGTWFLETTTMFAPGEDSVAEDTYKLAGLIEEGKTRSTRLLFDHRWGDCEDLSDDGSLRAAIVDAYGDAIEWNDADSIIEEFYDPRASTVNSRRFFLNAPTSAQDAWIAHHEWASRLDVSKVVADKEKVTLGFDGSRHRSGSVTDATALIGVRVSDGHIFELRVWEQPTGPAGDHWRVPTIEVDAEVENAFNKYDVVGFYADPAKWETSIAAWESKHGKNLRVKSTRDHPIEWWMTGSRSIMTVRALDQFYSAIIDGGMTHDGSSAITRHMLNARRRPSRTGMQIGKEHPDSALKIDAAVAATLAWQARVDALASGVLDKVQNTFVPRRLN